MRVGVIDIGSNAIRLAICEATRGGAINVFKNIREPIRLGGESFSSGKISEEKIGQLEKAFYRFHEIFYNYGVDLYKAVATSALRDAKNCKEVIRRVSKYSKIDIEIIDGLEESRLVHSAVAKAVDLKKKTSLIIDIGGGSVEVIACDNEKVLDNQSLPIGTLRLLQASDQLMKIKKLSRRKALELLIDDKLQSFLKIKKLLHPDEKSKFIGTGGNVRALDKLATDLYLPGKKVGYLSLKNLNEVAEILFSMNFDERVSRLKLKKDRADVILPAVVTLIQYMNFFGFKRLEVPHVGLKDGVLINLL